MTSELRVHIAGSASGSAGISAIPPDPLLVSVRSGAPVSMPGMMDTILDLGLNDATAAGLAALRRRPGFRGDCLRRFRQMYRDDRRARGAR